jgi:hypothetical protein
METLVMSYLMIGFVITTICMFAIWEEVTENGFPTILAALVLGSIIWPVLIYMVLFGSDDNEQD